jgi:peptidyl-prolyl cis-trans isomerase SurA
MKSWWILLAVVLAAAGCNRSFKANNPVVGPPPPRVRNAEQLSEAEQKTALLDDETPISRVSFSDGDSKSRMLSATDPVARVNGTTIFAGEVLGEQMMQFEAARGKAPPAEIRKAQDQLLKEKLQEHVDQLLMVEAVNNKLKPEQKEGIDGQLDKAFEENMVPHLMKATKSESIGELEGKLQEHGLSLPAMRKKWGDQQVALQWIKTKQGNDPKYSRQELLDAYNERIDQFTEPGKVKWQQIQVFYNKHDDDPAQVRAVLVKAAKELRAGREFDEVARKYSEANSGKTGGHWDWTQTSSLASKPLVKALDDLEVDEVSGIIDDGKSMQIIRVTARREQKSRSFEEVQLEVKNALIEEARKARTEKMIAELRATGVVETILDEPEAEAMAEPAEQNASKPRFSRSSTTPLDR